MTDPEMVVELSDPDFLAGVITAQGVTVEPAAPLLAHRLDQLVAGRATEEFPPPALKEAVRGMLRRGGFRPSGRNKPASEYLAQAAREGRFPRINNLVDIINLLSLQSGLPISLLDRDAVGPGARLRYGRPGERFIFNAAGQEIDLEGLICVCRAQAAEDVPLGTPIKDSMAGKITPQTMSVLAVVYATSSAISAADLGAMLADFAELLAGHGHAREVRNAIVRPEV